MIFLQHKQINMTQKYNLVYKESSRGRIIENIWIDKILINEGNILQNMFCCILACRILYAIYKLYTQRSKKEYLNYGNAMRCCYCSENMLLYVCYIFFPAYFEAFRKRVPNSQSYIRLPIPYFSNIVSQENSLTLLLNIAFLYRSSKFLAA